MPTMNDSATTNTIETDQRTRTHVLKPMVLQGIELNGLSRYVAPLVVIGACFMVMLWSSIELKNTRTALGKAQTRYESALKEKQRLELEMNLLLSPAAIEQQVNDLGLDPNVTVIEVGADKK